MFGEGRFFWMGPDLFFWEKALYYDYLPVKKFYLGYMHMKWILSFIYVLCAGSIFAAPWGAMADYDSPRPKRPKEQAVRDIVPSENAGERYLLKKVLAGQPIKVRMEEENGSPETWEAFRDKVQEAYNSWFLYTAKEIQKARREQEFADILPTLEKGIPLQFVSSEEDISVEFVDREEISWLCDSKNAGACYVFGGREIPVIYVPKNPKRAGINPFTQSAGKVFFANLTHEIGHSLGFSDQYIMARDSNTHTVYRGENTDKTIMNSRSLSLTCDDADGVINLIDITRKNKRGGQRGWRSLCKKSTAYYVNGSQLGTGPYGIYINEDETAWRLRTYHNGVYTGSTEFAIDYNVSLSPFAPLSERVIQRDLMGRPLVSEGTNGERVYYMHLYDLSVRLVTAKGKALLAERTALYVEGGKKITESFAFFGKDGRFVKLHAVKRGAQGKVTYLEGETGEVSVIMWFNKKGASKGLWSGPAVENGWGVDAPPFRAGVAGRISQQVKKRYASQQKERLEEQISAWFQRLPGK